MTLLLRRRLPHNHLARGNEPIRQQIHDVVVPARALVSGGKLLPVELVPDDEVAPAAALEVAFLKTRVARYHLGLIVEAGAEEEAVVVCGREVGFIGGATAFGGGCSRWWRERHDVGLVAGVLPRGEGVEGCRGCEEEVRAEAVVGVNSG